MGLSLRNITKKVADVIGGVERQVNPFDNGRTFSQKTPVNNYSVGQQIVRSTPVQSIYHSQPSDFLRMAAAKVTNNPAAFNNANLEKEQIFHNWASAITNPNIHDKNTIKAASSAIFSTVAPGEARAGVLPRVAAVAKPTVTKVSAADLAARSTTGVLNKIDPRLADMVRQRREIAETGAAQAKSKLKITNSLNKDEQTNLARVMKGTEKPVNDNVKAAAAEARKVLNTAYYRAKNVGVPVAKYRQNFYPQILNPKAFQEGNKFFDSQVNHLVTSGQAKTPAEAVGLLRNYKNSRTVSPYGNLTKSRSLDLTGYAENNAALHQYLDKAYATIAHHKVMGPEDKILNKVFDEVRQNGGDIEQAIKSYRQASGLERGSDAVNKAANIATNFQGATKLGLSTIGNFTQKANTAIAGGVGREVKAAAGQFTKENKDFIAKTGVKDEQLAHEALFGEQGVTSKIRHITAPGFENVEKSNRAEAALVGRDLANNLAQKAMKGDTNAAMKLQRDFGITNVGKRGLTQDQQIAAARRFVERTQFRTGPQDLPGWASTPVGRVVTQFKRYPYKQAQFLKREVLDEAARGNVMPLVRTAAIGAPLGVGAGVIGDKVRGANYNQSTPEKVLNIANDATGASLVTSLAQGLYPSSKDSNGYIAKTAKTLTGPTGSDAIKGAQAGFDATKGKTETAARFGLSHVPVVGTPAANRIFPGGTSATPASPGKPGQNLTIDQMNALAKTEEADFKKKMKPNDYGLTQLSNGKYIYQVGNESHTTDNLKEARKAIAEDSLKKSGDQIKIIGDTVYYKDSAGDVKSQPKALYDWNQADSKNKLEMDRAIAAGDTGKWLGLAQKEYDALEAKKKFYNPATEQDKIDDIELQQENLLQKAAKYAAKGVGGSGGGSGRKSVGSAYEYAVSPTAGVAAARPKITVRKPSGGSGHVVARRATKPKVTLKKSQV